MKPETGKCNKKEGKPIFTKILMPVIALVVIEILLLVGGVFGGGLTAHLNQNARDILGEKVLNRQSYLEGEMIKNWSQLSTAVEAVNAKTALLESQGQLSVQSLETDAAGSNKLLMDISEDLIALLRSNKVTGAYVVLNNEEMSTAGGAGARRSKPGLYLRDMDPASNEAAMNTDILIERSPSAVAQKLKISMDSGWKSRFEFERLKIDYYDFLLKPMQAAYDNRNSGLSYRDFGYWSGPYALTTGEEAAIYYSVPLILPDGTVYGVLGVDILLDYLKKSIPYDEIEEEKQGSYILARVKGADSPVDSVLINGPVFKQAAGVTDDLILRENDGNFEVHADGHTFYCAVEPLQLYNRNAPFSDEQWALIGAVKKEVLFSFSAKITQNLLMAILFTLAAGVAGCFLVSRVASRPITLLLQDITSMNRTAAICLKRTGIQEIDSLAASIEKLNRDVIDTATKFTQIIELASVKIAAFEIRRDENSLFITDGFFEIFNRNDIDTRKLTIASFIEVIESFQEFAEKRERKQDSVIFRVPTDTGPAFVKLRYLDDGVRCIGLAEDVTQNILELDRIEYERDHDSLTGLMNRRAFSRIMKDIFETDRESLKVAALVMLDLDNLKRMNDTFGHDCGDKYIRCAADCFRDAVPKGTLVSRISGDEFYLFYYGYESKSQIRGHLSWLADSIRDTRLYLPNHQYQNMGASGGLAWYPDDSEVYEELLRYSDFAMYRVKQSEKGSVKEFDISVFQRETFLLQNKAELTELIEKALVEYHFQPIVDARTAEIFGYEALLRPNTPGIRTVLEVIELARLERKLDQLEALTWQQAMKAFDSFLELGSVEANCRVFINSIASMRMTDTQIGVFETTYAKHLKNVVLELTEDERVDEASMQTKREKIRQWGASLALDDYGSGYNSDRLLLELAPEFIKVDLSIIRDIDRDMDKQKIVENLISYSHERNMKIIAEGVETEEEVRTVIRLGVDYLQGFWVARPCPEPVHLDENTRRYIMEMNRHSCLQSIDVGENKKKKVN